MGLPDRTRLKSKYGRNKAPKPISVFNIASPRDDQVPSHRNAVNRIGPSNVKPSGRTQILRPASRPRVKYRRVPLINEVNTANMMNPCKRVSIPETADQVRCHAKTKNNPTQGRRGLYDATSFRAAFSAWIANNVNTTQPRK